MLLFVILFFFYLFILIPLKLEFNEILINKLKIINLINSLYIYIYKSIDFIL